MAKPRSYRVLIVGLGASGVAAARLAAKEGMTIVVTDLRQEADLGEALARLPEIDGAFLGGHPLAALEDVDLVVTSPGVPADAEILVEAERRGIAIVPEVEFAWRRLREAPLVAVTGSNGKSTVTTLIAEMLADAGIAAVAGGNLGTPASELVMGGGWDAWVLEVSSFQAELMTTMAPRVGIFLNLSQDHLERHPSLAAYRDAKMRLFARQGKADAAVFNADDPALAGADVPARRLFFSLERRAEGWLDRGILRLGEEAVLPAGEMGISGLHNVANALAAALAARELGVAAESAARTLRRFSGLAHRHATVLDADGVRWVDDSKATNVGATLAGLRGYPDGSVHLILGGLGKGQDFAALAGEVRRAVRRLYLIGRDARGIAQALAGSAEIDECGTLAEAVVRCRRRVRAGETVLLAPACASFDQFSGYAERGEAFVRLVREGVEACP